MLYMPVYLLKTTWQTQKAVLHIRGGVGRQYRVRVSAPSFQRERRRVAAAAISPASPSLLLRFSLSPQLIILIFPSLRES